MNIDISIGIKIYETAGFEVKQQEKGFHLLKDGKKAYYCSSISGLTDLSHIVKLIEKHYFDRGRKFGVKSLQNSLKTLLEIK